MVDRLDRGNLKYGDVSKQSPCEAVTSALHPALQPQSSCYSSSGVATGTESLLLMECLYTTCKVLGLIPSAAQIRHSGHGGTCLEFQHLEGGGRREEWKLKVIFIYIRAQSQSGLEESLSVEEGREGKRPRN